MKQIFSIAKLTLKAAMRFKIVLLLAVFLVAAVFTLPLIIHHDGTARGFVQILLTYSLGLTVSVLSIASLWLSCGLIARDIDDCRMQVLAVKPIARWKIWIGKWLGVMILNAMLVALSGGTIYALLQYRAAQMPAEIREILNNEVFVARGSAKEPPVDLSEAIEAAYQDRLKQSSNQEVIDKNLLHRQVAETLKQQFQLVPANMMRQWDIPLGLAAYSLKDKPLFLRVKFIAMSHTSTFEDERTFNMMWEIGPENAPQSVRIITPMVPNTYREVELPPNLLDENGTLQVRFINTSSEETFFFDMNDGMEVLYRQGGFLPNYIKGLLILLCWLGLMTSIGLCASSFLSFPVATFFVTGILILSFSTGTMNQVIEEGGIYGVDHETGLIKNQSVLDKVYVGFFKATKGLIGLVQNFSPVELLSQGRTITYSMLFMAVLQIIGIVGGIFALIGIACFTRRELALAKGGQG